MPLIGLVKVNKAISDLVDDQNDKIKAIWIQGLSAVITSSPVHFDDGGRLRNGWFLTTRKPSSQLRGRNPRAQGAFSSLEKMPDNVLGKTIYFTNNVPYVSVVEYGGFPMNPKLGTWTGSNYQKLSSGGYSKQAPAGMARINVVKMKNKLARL